MSVNGQQAHFYDPWANDQDWGLYFALKYGADAVYDGLPEEEKDAFFQMVLLRIHAMYLTMSQYYCPKEILSAANGPFCEKDGAVKIDAVTAYAQTEYAYAKNGKWQYCGSESYDRSGLAMYMRKRGQEWKQQETAPSLNYQVRCDGGKYDLWVLLRIDPASPSPLGLAIDGTYVDRSGLYNSGKTWRYEAEQVWRWIPLTSLLIAEGTHLLTLAVMASGIRIDRLYLTRTGERPPVDCEW